VRLLDPEGTASSSGNISPTRARHRRTYRVWGLATAAWCAAFGALSLYSAAGGTLGVDLLAASLQERGDEREAGFVALVAATGIVKLAGAIAPLWLVFGPPPARYASSCCSLLGRRGAAGLIRPQRRRDRLDRRGPRHDGKRDLVRSAVGAQPGCLAAAVPDYGLGIDPARKSAR
jgi:hypothetical protein